MKKILVVVVAVAVAVMFSVTLKAETTQVKAKEVAKTTSTGEQTKTVVKEKAQGVKDTETITTSESGKNVSVQDVITHKKGDLWKETVKFHKFDQNGDYIYVMKDDKVIRLKHKLNESDKKDMLQRKQGDTITVTSTYPLTNQDLAVVMGATNAKNIKNVK